MAASHQEQAVEIRLEDVFLRVDQTTAVILSIRRYCFLTGQTKESRVTIGLENTLRLFLEP